jgi:thiamine biosynthesis lipoprotein
MSARILKAAVASGCFVLALILLSSIPGGDGTKQSLNVRRDNARPNTFRVDFQTMGTDATLKACLSDPSRARQIFVSAIDRIREIESRMSTYLPESELSQLNASGGRGSIPLSEDTIYVLKQAREIAEMTDGAFDPTYAPLRDLWRAATMEDSLPSGEDIEICLERIGMRDVEVGEDGARFKKDGMQVDLGGIAKGYAIDEAVEVLKVHGAVAGLVDIGGDIRVFGGGKIPEPWKIMVNDPRGGKHPPIYLLLKDGAVATSGDYARYFRIREERYSHIIDPRNGWPAEDASSVTVIAPRAILADGLATAISVMGSREGRELADSLEGVECMAISVDSTGGDDHVEHTSGFGKYMDETCGGTP